MAAGLLYQPYSVYSVFKLRPRWSLQPTRSLVRSVEIDRFVTTLVRYHKLHCDASPRHLLSRKPAPVAAEINHPTTSRCYQDPMYEVTHEGIEYRRMIWHGL
ncbi:hypothetical protein PIB30_011312 [Stylosanthes scabra]|uniref:Uncharacterized protein n=1 Tax=Stylosanthes scabra TaxID=79078 RepID=A0ABU6W5C8_9FABA|nr:hypothetical protein [Stylosanthes scabra]